MKKRNSLVNRHSVLLAAALLVTSTGIAAAKTHQHRATYGTGQTGEQSSTNPLAGFGRAGYGAPHEVPENGGAATEVVPGFAPN